MNMKALMMLVLVALPLAMAVSQKNHEQHKVIAAFAKQQAKDSPISAKENLAVFLKKLNADPTQSFHQSASVEGKPVPESLIKKMHNMMHLSPSVKKMYELVSESGATLQEVGEAFWHLYSSIYVEYYDADNHHQYTLKNIDAEHESLKKQKSELETAIKLDTTAIHSTQAALDSEKATLGSLETTLATHQKNKAHKHGELTNTTARCEATDAYLATMIKQHETSIGHIQAVKKVISESSINQVFEEKHVEIASLLRTAASDVSGKLKTAEHEDSFSNSISEAQEVLKQGAESEEDEGDYTDSVKSRSAKRLLALVDELVKGLNDSLSLYKSDKAKNSAQCATDISDLNAEITRLSNEIDTTNSLIGVAKANIESHEATLAARKLVKEGNEKSLAATNKTIADLVAERAAKVTEHANRFAVFEAEIAVMESVWKYIDANQHEMLPSRCHKESIGCPLCSEDKHCDDGLYCNGVEFCRKNQGEEHGICERAQPQDRPCGLVENCRESDKTCGCASGQSAKRGSVFYKQGRPTKNTKLSPDPQEAVPAMKSAKDYSYCFWVKPDDENSWGNVFMRRAREYEFLPSVWMSNGHFYVGYATGKGGQWTWHDWIGTMTPAPAGQWSHMCFSVSSTQGKASMWGNSESGVQFGGVTWFSYLLPKNGAAPFYFSGPDHEAAPAEFRDIEFFDHVIDQTNAACIAKLGHSASDSGSRI